MFVSVLMILMSCAPAVWAANAIAQHAAAMILDVAAATHVGLLHIFIPP
jgi:hypothetical protein